MLNSKSTDFFDPQNLYHAILNQGFASVPFDISSTMIQEAMQSFMRFLAEPENIKTTIDFSIAPLHRRGDVGYKQRKANDHIYNDSKEFFHFHPALMPRYLDYIDSHPVVKDFIQKAYPIWQLAYQTVQKILLNLEAQFPGIVSHVFDAKEVHVVLRFLKYEWSQSGKYLAKPHYDAGSFTLAIAESCPGLRIGTKPENLAPVQHKDETALFFLSSNFNKIMQTDELKPAWHDVIQLDETAIGKPFARWALVAFIEGHSVEALPRTETHKWFKPSGV